MGTQSMEEGISILADQRVEGLAGVLVAGMVEGGSSGSVRQANLALVASLVLSSPDETSRAEIAAKTGLTGPTVSRLIRELISLGIVIEETAERDGSMGRPSTPVLPAIRTIAGIGLEINVDYIAGRAIDLAGVIIGQFHVAIDGTRTEPLTVLELLRKETDTLIAAVRSARVLEVCGVCLALPGVVDREAGSIVYGSNLGWHDVVPGDVLVGTLSAGGPFSIENDANLQAIAATASLRGPDGTPPSFLYVFGGIGVGGAIVREGRLERGTRGWAGEIGHTTVEPDGAACYCGSCGCLETYVGRRNLLQAANLPESSSIDDIVAALESGDADVRTAVERAGFALGVALANALNLLDLRDVVLGTDLGRLLPWLAPQVEAELDRRLLGRTGSDINILPMPITSDPSSVGGAILCLRQRLEPTVIAR